MGYCAERAGLGMKHFFDEELKIEILEERVIHE